MRVNPIRKHGTWSLTYSAARKIHCIRTEDDMSGVTVHAGGDLYLSGQGCIRGSSLVFSALELFLKLAHVNINPIIANACARYLVALDGNMHSGILTVFSYEKSPYRYSAVQNIFRRSWAMKMPVRRTMNGRKSDDISSVEYRFLERPVEKPKEKPEFVDKKEDIVAVRTLTGAYVKTAKADLLEQYGLVCQGCYRKFDHERYLEVDHILPISDGGSDDIENLILLCSPCNRKKSNRLTLSGLRWANKKSGFMADQK